MLLAAGNAGFAAAAPHRLPARGPGLRPLTVSPCATSATTAWASPRPAWYGQRVPIPPAPRRRRDRGAGRPAAQPHHLAPQDECGLRPTAQAGDQPDPAPPWTALSPACPAILGLAEHAGKNLPGPPVGERRRPCQREHRPRLRSGRSDWSVSIQGDGRRSYERPMPQASAASSSLATRPYLLASVGPGTACAGSVLSAAACMRRGPGWRESVSDLLVLGDERRGTWPMTTA